MRWADAGTGITGAVALAACCALAGCSSESTAQTSTAATSTTAAPTPDPTTSRTTTSTSSTGSSPAAPACSAGRAPILNGTSTAYATAADLEPTHALAGQVGRPTAVAAATGQPGWDVISVPVNVQVRTAGVFAVSPASFVLVAPSGQRCAQPVTNPLPDAFTIIQADQSHPGAGEVAFLVPHGADLSTYSVMYTDQSGGTAAIAQWSATGATASATTTAGCDGKKSPYDAAGVAAEAFGSTQRVGASANSVQVTAATPSLEDLPPSDSQPGDVNGVALTVTVHAGRSLGFVERGQFQLVDASGKLCRYSETGSTGESLTSDLVPAGRQKTYTIVFWVPRGSTLGTCRLLYLADPSATTVQAMWIGQIGTTAGQPTKG